MDNVLSWVDYIVVLGVLFISVSIGVYYATCAGGQKTSKEYFLADRSMHWFPVGVSISMSTISAITFLGTSSLAYYRGPGYWVTIFSRVIGGLITATMITPVFYNLGITSIYEYLERRFNPVTRYIAVSIHIVSTFLVLGLVTYAPALALNAVTGLNLVGSILTVGIVCTFYSTVGGIRAVVWTDLFQSLIMVLGIVVIIATAIVKVGGVGAVWSMAVEGERTSTIFDFRLDPTVALSFWANLIGGIFFILPYVATNQNQAQRYLTCSSLEGAKYSVLWGFSLMGLFEVSVVVMGFVVFSFYYGCDPLSAGKISSPDQIVPYFVVDVFGGFPGITGLLVSAIFSAALSTFSTAINGLSTVTGEAFVRRVWPTLPEDKFMVIMKFLSAIYGSLFMLMAWVVSVAGSSLIPIGSRIIGALLGPVLAIVLLGMLVPRGNAVGAITGVIAGIAIGLWLLVGSLVFPAPRGGGLPLSLELCPSNMTDISETDIMSTTSEALVVDTRPWIYRVSFLYVGFITTVVTFLIGIVTSLITRRIAGCDESIECELLSPPLVSIYRKLPANWRCKLVFEGKNELDMKRQEENMVEDDGNGSYNLGHECDDTKV